MPRLKANSIIYGDYSGRTGGVYAGLIHPGEIFDATEEQAVSLESRGLAYRYYPPIPPRPQPIETFQPGYQTKVITAAPPPVVTVPIQPPLAPSKRR